MRGHHLCDIEFHRPVIGVSGYLVRARYVSIYDVFQGLLHREPTTPFHSHSLRLSLSLSLSPSVLPARLLLRESSEGVSNVLPSCGPVYGVRLPHARFTVN